jgi:hypothetical protein
MDWSEGHPIETNKGFMPPVPTLSLCAKMAITGKASYPLKNVSSAAKMSSDSVWQFMNRCQNQYSERLKKNPSLHVPKNMSLYHCSCMSDFFRDNLQAAAGAVPDSVNHYCAQWAISQTSKQK